MVTSSKLALIIGVDVYHHKRKDGTPSLIQLPSCKKDASDLCQLLRLHGYDYEIFQGEPVLGSNFPEGHGHRILEITKKFFYDVEAGQTLLFYFSGHGIADRGQVYLAMPETDPESPIFDSLNLSDLSSLINYSRSTRIVGIIDACHSGAANLSLLNSKGVDKSAAENEAAEAVGIYDKINENIPIAEGKCLLLSSQAYQKSQAEENNNSVYTRYLIEGLKGTSFSKDENGIPIPASVDEYGNVTPQTLHDYVYNRVANEIKSQTPRIKSSVSSKIILVQHLNLASIREQQSNEFLFELLKEGKIEDFNAIRKQHNSTFIDLSGKNLSKMYLKGANLSRVSLSGADLSGAILSSSTGSSTTIRYADLSRANLSDTDLSNSDLLGTDFSNAYLKNANLSWAFISDSKFYCATIIDVNMSGANFSRANLVNAKLFSPNLSLADISNADLSFSSIINCSSYNDLICLDADFNTCIINNGEIVSYLQKNSARNVHTIICHKDVLISKDLVKLGFEDQFLKELLKYFD